MAGKHPNKVKVACARKRIHRSMLKLSVGATEMDRLVEKIRAIREALGEFV